ncbi:DUF6544 family protein [Marinobacter halophilus]|uniref:Uncharacterized protein n=1 Tax=Marinobacter halophilus TaxID=1323740 RepID=A0A2T1KDA0_9GAMM|nr:DUF6544 family protein [Marinobacter halophilus]PSF08119.1 hypothetical protein C7H08_09845 [Marinobacter halophilus]GGC59644.1 hypothetical protein GCM10011362_05040 [Marinobacter halophilus]
MTVTAFLLGFLILTGLALSAWRHLDHRTDRKAMRGLVGAQPVQPSVFTAEMIADLPEPARRYFLYTIEPGTPLATVARISMAGRFGMGDRDNPNYLDFEATQVLAVPSGFVWKMRARRGLMRLSGSDSQRWTRFWLMGLLPVARLGGDQDHTRSAFGRYVAEAVFWTPAALLPGPGVTWESLAADQARVTVEYRGLSQSVDLKVSADGQPIEVSFQRWSNANPEKQHRLQPFGGYLSEFRSFDGFRLPTHVEAGNHFETDQYFPFFVADVSDVEFPRG